MNQIKEVADTITVVAAAAVTQGDLVIFGPWLGIALNTAAIGDDLTLDIRQGVEIDALSTVAVGASVGAAIYYNPTTKVFAAASAAGNALVGYTTKAKNADNVFRFEKVRYAAVA
jgi:predicted RecA/RadA family phage recombinase